MGSTSNRYLLVLGLGCVLFLGMPPTAAAKPRWQEVGVEDVLLDVTVVKRRLLPEGRWGLRLAVSGAGVLDCRGSQACMDAGLHGSTVAIEQEIGLTIVIDVIGAGIKGRTRGTLGIRDAQSAPWGFRGRIAGRVLPGPDASRAAFQLSVEAGGRFRRRLSVDLSGVVNKATGEFEALEGSGVLRGTGGSALLGAN